eukprot:Em0020g183a
MHEAFKYLHRLSKFRGPKFIVRKFSHEVTDLHLALALLQQQNKDDRETWETRYVLLLWLSFLVIIPFDLNLMDGTSQKRTVDCILELAEVYLQVFDKSQDAAAQLVAKFMCRPDIQKTRLKPFLDWALEVMTSTDKKSLESVNRLCGVLLALSSLFKLAKREEVVEHAPVVLKALSACCLADSSNTLLRKLNMKLAQRLGLTCLKVRLASWRYQRGKRSLEETLATTSDDQHCAGTQETLCDGEEFGVPEETEVIIGLLLTGLADKDTVVRWSAAKGIGRITGRLHKDLADEVVGSLLECFSFRETDTSWHGGCLALAELGRRGLLLPGRLKDVVPVVLKALVYDERRGSYSVGSNVRDAACYLCWAFARAYDPVELKPYVQSLATGLVVTAVFDREVNCRRAASAAFQENVGRQGTFPHGIDILTAADYFAVGVRSNAYLQVSCHVAQYPEYTWPLIQHLVMHKLPHWDSSLRQLASKALHSLTRYAPSVMRNEVLPALISQVTSPDPCLRHGSLLGVAETMHALYECAFSPPNGEGVVSLQDCLGQGTINSLLDVVPRLVAANVFRGAIGEPMRPAALLFIENMSLCGLVALAPDKIDVWQSVIDENLSHTQDSIREAAAQALGQLSSKYYSTSRMLSEIQDKLINRYVDQLNSPFHIARMGCAAALGVLPRELLLRKLEQVVQGLSSSILNSQKCEPKFAEARRSAIAALISLCRTVGVASNGSPDQTMCPLNLSRVFQSSFAGVKDYTTDSRGDIGRSVREVSMLAIGQVFILAANSDPSVLRPDWVQEAMGSLVQQSNEKIDSTRVVAFDQLLAVIHHQPEIPHIPCHKELKEIYSCSATSGTDWRQPHNSYHLSVKLLGLKEYCYPTLVGLVTSVGGLTESLVRHSSQALLGHMKSVCSSIEGLALFSDAVLSVFRDYKKVTRVTIPLLKTLDFLLSSAVYDVYVNHSEHQPFLTSLFEAVREEITSSQDVVKLLASVSVFCGLLQFPSIQKSALNQLMLLVCSPLPKVRKTTADQLYITVVTYDDIIPDNVKDDVIALLSETTWDAIGDMGSLQGKRNELCQLLCLPVPRVKERSAADTQKKTLARDELASYKDLVERAGY